MNSFTNRSITLRSLTISNSQNEFEVSWCFIERKVKVILVTLGFWSQLVCDSVLQCKKEVSGFQEIIPHIKSNENVYINKLPKMLTFLFSRHFVFWTKQKSYLFDYKSYGVEILYATYYQQSTNFLYSFQNSGYLYFLKWNISKSVNFTKYFLF